MRKRSTLVSLTLCIGLTAGLGLAGCAPAAMDNNSGGQGGSSGGTGGSSGRGGSGGSSSSGSGGSSSGSGGSSSGTGGSSSGTGGSSSGSGGSGGSGGASGGSGGSSGGSGGSSGSGGSGGTGGSTGGSGGSRSDASKPEGGGSPDAAGAVTFKKLFADVFLPTCGGPAGRCHQVVRDQYFVFNMGEEMRSYMLLVPNTPANGTIPQRVMTLLNYVTPTTAGNPATVRMPPQSGPNLGNPQIKRMPLTADQIAQIRMWAMTGAKFE